MYLDTTPLDVLFHIFSFLTPLRHPIPHPDHHNKPRYPCLDAASLQRHPFLALSAVSKVLRSSIEMYSTHLLKQLHTPLSICQPSHTIMYLKVAITPRCAICMEPATSTSRLFLDRDGTEKTVCQICQCNLEEYLLVQLYGYFKRSCRKCFATTPTHETDTGFQDCGNCQEMTREYKKSVGARVENHLRTACTAKGYVVPALSIPPGALGSPWLLDVLQATYQRGRQLFRQAPCEERSYVLLVHFSVIDYLLMILDHYSS